MNNEFELDSLLKQLAEDHKPALPSPDLIWWRAQILRKQQEKERIERPIVIMRMLAAAVCAAIFLVLLAGNWAALEAAMNGNVTLLLPLGIVALAVCAISALLVWSPSPKA